MDKTAPLPDSPWVRESIEAQRRTGIEPGWYITETGLRARCVVDKDGVSVHYDDRTHTAAYHETFKRWGYRKETPADFAFRTARDAHAIGLRYAKELLLVGSRLSDEPAIGAFQKAVAERVAEEGVDGLAAFMASTAKRLSGGAAPVGKVRDAQFRAEDDGSISWRASAKADFEPVAGEGRRTMYSKLYVPGCFREVVNDVGVRTRMDERGHRHCDGAPAVIGADGSEAWFVHGRELPPPAPAPEAGFPAPWA